MRLVHLLALLVVTFAWVPVASAEIPGSCVGEYVRGDTYSYCFGVHRDDQGNIDCIGTYVYNHQTNTWTCALPW